MSKNKLFTTKEYTVRLTAHQALHEMFVRYIQRFMFTEGRKIDQSDMEVKTV